MRVLSGLRVLAGVLLMAAGPAMADDWEDALAAHDAGQYETAVKLMRPLAEAGNVDAQNRLSHMYWYGEGVPVDYEESVALSRKAAEAGSPRAHHNIGVYYRSGHGTTTSNELAFEWHMKGAMLGDDRGALAVAQLYATGLGVTQNLREANKWLQIASDRGEPNAQLMVARAQLALGRVREADPLLQAAAATRLAEAQFMLGKLFLDGDSGWPTDTTQAVMWLTIAARSGCLEAPSLLKRAESALDPRDSELMSDLIEGWEAANPVELGRAHPIEPTSCVSQPRSSV